MPGISTQTSVGAPPDRLFAVTLAADQIRGYANWNPAFARGIRIIAETGGVGTVFETPLEAPGAIGRAEIVEYDPPRAMGSLVRGGVFRELRIRFTIEADGDGSRLTQTIDYSLKYAPMSWLIDAMVLRGKLRASSAAQLAAMKERAEFFERLAA